MSMNNGCITVNTCTHTRVCTRMFAASLFTTAEKGLQPQRPSQAT